ncbi:hypothetical protein BGZ57DRAFT_403504 [Hyaloscypha finlandica]|nr:hypothetical protein BGZ57DRAFT_403504 [Hyaloscypha finlandica]
MDPLSITAGCSTLVTTVLKVSIQINGFVREVRDARWDLDAVSRELISLKTVLEILSEDAENSTGGGFPRSLVRQICGILTNCGGVLEQIEASLQKHAGGGVKRGVKWSLSGRDDVNKLRSSLEAHKSALDIALDMVALTMAREIKADTEELRNDTAAIKDDTTQILAEIERLQARLPQDDRIRGGAGFTLQRYLDNLSSYAETSCDLSDRTSNVHVEERGPGHLVRDETPDKGHDQTKKATKAKNGKGMAIKVKSTSKMAAVETSRVGHRDRVLGEDDIATILPPPSNTRQVPDLNRSTNGAELEGRILTHSYTGQSYVAQNEIATQLLFQNGFDVKQKDFDKEMALRWAAAEGHEAAVLLLLLEKGADIKAKDNNSGWTALHYAASEGHEAMVQLLLEKGANIEAKANEGWTALHWAAWEGHEAM